MKLHIFQPNAVLPQDLCTFMYTYMRELWYDTVRSLVWQTDKQIIGNPSLRFTLRNSNDVQKYCNSHHTTVFAVEHDRVWLGSALVYTGVLELYGLHPKLTENIPGIDFLIVHPNSRGKGIGTRLVQRICEYLQENKIRDVLVSVNADNKAAQHIYSEHKFKPVEYQWYGTVKSRSYKKCQIELVPGKSISKIRDADILLNKLVNKYTDNIGSLVSKRSDMKIIWNDIMRDSEVVACNSFDDGIIGLQYAPGIKAMMPRPIFFHKRGLQPAYFQSYFQQLDELCSRRYRHKLWFVPTPQPLRLEQVGFHHSFTIACKSLL